MGTPHIHANPGDFAKVVLMPGDPKRAEFIVNTYLHDVKKVNDVRCAYGFTGLTKNGKRISVMASGMGMPSIGIYSHELFTEYGVETIIRIGTCGSYSENVQLKDIIFAQGVSTDSNWMGQYDLNGGTYSAIGDFKLLRDAVEIAESKGEPYHVGNVLSADVFYDHNKDQWKKWKNLGIIAVEMESYALYQIAAELKKKALCILTASDSFVIDKKLTPEERQLGLGKMIEVAIGVAEKYSD